MLNRMPSTACRRVAHRAVTGRRRGRTCGACGRTRQARRCAIGSRRSGADEGARQVQVRDRDLACSPGARGARGAVRSRTMISTTGFHRSWRPVDPRTRRHQHNSRSHSPTRRANARSTSSDRAATGPRRRRSRGCVPVAQPRDRRSARDRRSHARSRRSLRPLAADRIDHLAQLVRRPTMQCVDVAAQLAVHREPRGCRASARPPARPTRASPCRHV